MMKPDQAHLTTSLKLGVRSGWKWKTLPSDLLQIQVQDIALQLLCLLEKPLGACLEVFVYYES